MPKAKAPKPWRRESPGRYVSADERFSIDESAPGHWYVTDREQPDELGQPRITGPFSSLTQAKGEADSGREAPTPVSPLAGRMAEGQRRPPQRAADARPGRPAERPAMGRRPTTAAASRSRRSSPPAPPEPVLRPAVPTDAPGIARLWLDLAELLAESDPARYRRPSEDAFRAALAGHLADPGPDAATFVVAVGDDTVACAAVRLVHATPYPERLVIAALDRPRAAVRALAVDDAWRRKGLERRLLAAVEGWAREHGAAAVSIDAAGDGLQAAALYRGAGYEQAQPAFERMLDPD